MEQSQYRQSGVPGRLDHAMAQEESVWQSCDWTPWAITVANYLRHWALVKLELGWRRSCHGKERALPGYLHCCSHAAGLFIISPANVWFYPVIFPQTEPLWMERAKEWREPLYLLEQPLVWSRSTCPARWAGRTATKQLWEQYGFF